MDTQLKRIRFRCRHRGNKEMDIILGSFADAHLERLDAVQLDRLEALLEAPDPDLYAWVTGKSAAPREHDHDVMRLLMSYSNVS